jgi:hypothetical protein
MKIQHKIMYREDKAVAVVATFLYLSNGQCDKYWLNKVMYYVERQSLLLAGQPMFFDDLFSAPYGPIASNVNDGIDLASYPSKSIWSKCFRLENNNLKLEKTPDLEVLSDFEIELINSTFEKFKGKNFNEMHKFFRGFPEHTETNSRIAISYESILSAGGLPEEIIKETIEDISYLQFIEGSLTCDAR